MTFILQDIGKVWYFLASATRRSSEGTTDRGAENCQKGVLHERTGIARDLEDVVYTRHARVFGR